MGIYVSENSIEAKDIEEVISYRKVGRAEENLPYATDGIVVKVNQLDLQASAGLWPNPRVGPQHSSLSGAGAHRSILH